MILQVRSLYLSLILCLVLVTSNLLGQTPLPLLPNGQPDTVLIKNITAIPVNQIPAELEKIENDLKVAERKTIPKKSMLAIDSLFPLYVDFLKVQKRNALNFIQANPNRQKIDNLINKWEGYFGQLDIWQNTINDAEDKNMDLISPLKEKEYRWSLTLDLAKAENAPASLINNVERIVRNLTSIRKKISDENNALITLETRIIDEKSIINQTIEDFQSLKNSEIYNVFYKRHEALWNTPFKSLDQYNESKEIESIPNKFSNIRAYIIENQLQVYYFLFQIALIILLLFYFKKAFLRVKFTEQDANLQRAKEIVVSHAVPSIVFIVAISALLFLKNIPFLLSDILILIALFASIPMLRSLIYTRFNNLILFIIIFFVINALKTYVWFPPPYYRIYLIIEAVLMLGLLYYYSNPYLVTRKLKTRLLGKVFIRSVPVFYIIILTSIISNLFGYTNLTDLSLKFVTLSSALTVIFYGILMVASGLIVGGIHLIFINQSTYSEERKLWVEKKSLLFIRILVFLWWGYYFLGLLDMTEAIGLWYSDFIVKSYSFGSLSFTLDEIINFTIVLIASFLISNFVSMVVDGGALSFLKLPKGIPSAIALVIRYLVISFGFVLALSSLGIDLSSFNLMAGALGLGIGFGLQTIISNFVSGIILVFERPIFPGDTVEVGNLLGTVSKIGVRASKVRTFDGAEVVVPNNNLISNDLINWTLSDNVKRIEILIGAAYGSDPNVVLEILTEASLKNEFTLTDPAPIALFNEFGDSSLNFRLLVWVPYDKGLISKSNISVAIYDAFKENGIEIPFPQSDIHVKDINAENRKATNTIKQTVKPRESKSGTDQKIMGPSED
jgi:small-conductance mechanosensitive channel